ncbi:hypothetical protein DICSQDRAFT_132280 [Dichomitus squalens LYAD-421 SS1]|uniref:uncharacterized protein n=1 Tax=Dichomitus squalens (strain LYAD-421) TaxID=732165 RepID=UPI0004415EEB|nr:uncharacterized protein DICSQDRAFT_132280 [Dichomitus squalens LYAD-421 SS1]EJF66135.1 hypothetical protein DICSQDRAFT_132280 [Dichomitus squalens LYAD-421 SS1]
MSSRPAAGIVQSRPTPQAPRPSATAIVVNSQNEVLLVHRNPKSSSFANAHVFPGGNYDKKQDEGQGLPFTAIREVFEESGLLLVHPSSSGLPIDAELDKAREAIHAQKRLLNDFLIEHDLKPNVEGLLPFTTWITPPIYPRRFRTQFYVTFLDETRSAGFSSGDKQERLPTPDGGQEVIEARFVHPTKALEEFYSERITLFPPQFYLLTTLSSLLEGPRNTPEQRERVRALSNGAFGQMVINPRVIRDKDAEAEGYKVITYEGDEANGGSPGRRHRCRLKFGQGGSATYITLERNFDIFTEIESHLFSAPAKL